MVTNPDSGKEKRRTNIPEGPCERPPHRKLFCTTRFPVEIEGISTLVLQLQRTGEEKALAASS